MVRRIVSLGGWRKLPAWLTTDSDHATEALRQAAIARLQATPMAHADWQTELTARLLTQLSAGTSLPIEPYLSTAIADLIALEADAFRVPSHLSGSLLAEVAQRTHLRRLIAFTDHAQPLIAAWVAALADILAPITAASPTTPTSNPSTLSIGVPLIAFLKDANATLSRIIARVLPFADDRDGPSRPGARLAARLIDNLLVASGLARDQAERRPQRLKWPTQSPLAGAELVATYLGGTPLHNLLLAPIPLPIGDAIGFEHALTIAPSGGGKTQTLQYIITCHLNRPPNDVPAIIVLDSQGDMLDKLAHLDLFDPDHGALADHLLLINPTDIDHPPALNLFDLDTSRLESYGPAASEGILNGVIELYDFIFGALLAAETTQRQSLIFRYCARLMLVIPGATIYTLRELLDPDTGNDLYQAHADKLAAPIRAFFDSQFLDKQFISTRKQLLRRLWGILENPTFERMLTAPTLKLDLFDAINTGKIVLVNTAKDFLKAERSSLLGRIIIALTLQAVIERAAIPEAKRRPCYLVVDEAAEYFGDANIDELLSQARKYKCGIVCALQYLDQAPPQLRRSLMTNTSFKLAAGVSDRDARELAPDMRTSHEFIAQQSKTANATTFAAFVRNLTPAAVPFTVPFGTLEAQPKMSDAAYARLIAANRARLSGPATAPPPRPADLHPTPPARPRPKLRAGAQEHITLPEHNLTLTAKLDTQAVGLCALHVLSLDRFERNAAPFARFTLAAPGGARVTLERKIIDTVAVDPFGGTTLNCPVIALRFKIAHHDLTERFALAVSPASEVLLGQPVLAGRFLVDSDETFLLDQPHPPAHNQPAGDDWRS